MLKGLHFTQKYPKDKMQNQIFVFVGVDRSYSVVFRASKKDFILKILVKILL